MPELTISDSPKVESSRVSPLVTKWSKLSRSQQITLIAVLVIASVGSLYLFWGSLLGLAGLALSELLVTYFVFCRKTQALIASSSVAQTVVQKPTGVSPPLVPPISTPVQTVIPAETISSNLPGSSPISTSTSISSLISSQQKSMSSLNAGEVKATVEVNGGPAILQKLESSISASPPTPSLPVPMASVPESTLSSSVQTISVPSLETNIGKIDALFTQLGKYAKEAEEGSRKHISDSCAALQKKLAQYVKEEEDKRIQAAEAAKRKAAEEEEAKAKEAEAAKRKAEEEEKIRIATTKRKEEEEKKAKELQGLLAEQDEASSAILTKIYNKEGLESALKLKVFLSEEPPKTRPLLVKVYSECGLNFAVWWKAFVNGFDRREITVNNRGNTFAFTQVKQQAALLTWLNTSHSTCIMVDTVATIKFEKVGDFVYLKFSGFSLKARATIDPKVPLLSVGYNQKSGVITIQRGADSRSLIESQVANGMKKDTKKPFILSADAMTLTYPPKSDADPVHCPRWISPDKKKKEWPFN